VSLYDPFLYQSYNLFYTSLPIVIYSIFDEEYSAEVLMGGKEYSILFNFRPVSFQDVYEEHVIHYSQLPLLDWMRRSSDSASWTFADLDVREFVSDFRWVCLVLSFDWAFHPRIRCLQRKH
jgi:hypothetical protein